jgi:hypothetical protein
MATLLPHSFEIRTIFGISVNESSPPIKVLQSFLEQLGLKMTCIGRLGPRGDRRRVYQLQDLSPDTRREIFSLWQTRDESVSTATLINNPIEHLDTAPPELEEEQKLDNDLEQLQQLISSCDRTDKNAVKTVKAIVGEVFEAIPTIRRRLLELLDQHWRAWLLAT